jgi:cephalosporin hydroxylase
MNGFDDEVCARIRAQHANAPLRADARAFMRRSIDAKYSYNFSWMGRPIIQYPQDVVAMQELLWQVQPDLVVETGIAHGGSLVLYASICELIGKGSVLGIDIDIRAHNRRAIEAHPMAKRIEMIEGSSIDPAIVEQVHARAAGLRTFVVLDSNHSHAHVLGELRAYAPLVSVDSYCVVFDTIVEDLPPGLYPDRPWDVGDNPRTAVAAWLAENADFVVDEAIEAKTLITVAPGGFLRRIR